jgi:hypothetical protein
MMMRSLLATIAVLTTFAAPHEASAQGANLSGRWRCVAACEGPPGGVGSITQYDWKLNVVNASGQASRGWVDYPGRIWLYEANQGAIYSPDGSRLQFDRGAVWLRAPEVVVLRRR